MGNCEYSNYYSKIKTRARSRVGDVTILTKKLLLFHDCREPGTPDPTMAIRSNSDTLKQVSYSLCNVVSGQWTGDEYE